MFNEVNSFYHVMGVQCELKLPLYHFLCMTLSDWQPLCHYSQREDSAREHLNCKTTRAYWGRIVDAVAPNACLPMRSLWPAPEAASFLLHSLAPPFVGLAQSF